MKREELAKHLLTNFAKEVDDADKYYTMAMTAEETDYADLSYGLIEMAKDEYTHAQFIMNTMTEMGFDIPAEEKAKWAALDDKMHDSFW